MYRGAAFWTVNVLVTVAGTPVDREYVSGPNTTEVAAVAPTKDVSIAVSAASATVRGRTHVFRAVEARLNIQPPQSPQLFEGKSALTLIGGRVAVNH